jgi:hypothetical protein
MEKKKQSSVEWLVEELNHNIEFIPLAHWDKIRDIVQQAKAMHKEEMISSYKNAMASAYFNTHNWMPQEGYIHKSEQYYNETFGGQDNE